MPIIKLVLFGLKQDRESSMNNLLNYIIALYIINERKAMDLVLLLNTHFLNKVSRIFTLMSKYLLLNEILANDFAFVVQRIGNNITGTLGNSGSNAGFDIEDYIQLFKYYFILLIYFNYCDFFF